MAKQNMQNLVTALAIVALVVVSFGGTAALAQPDVTVTDATKTIEATGTYTVTASPDQAVIYLGYETNRETAAEAQQELADKMAAIRSALLSKGVASGDIETASYNVRPHYEWTDGKSVLQGYDAMQTLKITARDVGKTGAIIDAASAAGANRVQYVSFALSDAKRAEVRKQALTEASKNAREQADAIAKGLNVRITGIERVSVGYDYQPYPYVYGKALAAGASESAPTQVDPANVEVSATVQVTFSFE